MANRLEAEKSPYLRQHAQNPVDWLPWGNEAFERARNEDKPLLVSIGYSSCHWCHVMAHESFENEAVARLMNGSFVNVKVDREERPDVDAVYMEAVQAMTGQGGWPLNVFLTPDLKPFFGGTYWPPAPRHGMPSWPQVLQSIALAWRNERERVLQSAAELGNHMAGALQFRSSDAELSEKILDQAVDSLAANFDEVNGGFGGAPKFPQPLNLEFLLRTFVRTGNRNTLRIVTISLDRMAAGGIYDQIGGGFHRYSVDAEWTVPHFEKMLYDNALLSRIYVNAWQVTANPRYRAVAEGILDYLLADMTSPEGGFYSAEDADSEGEEGTYYVWTPEEVHAAVDSAEAPLIAEFYGITQPGNFEGKSIPTNRTDVEVLGKHFGRSPEDIPRVVEEGRHSLRMARSQRVRPERDSKILTGWNALALRSLALAGRAFNRDDYLRAATRNANFLWKNLFQEGLLLHLYNEGPSTIPAYLDDYAFLIEAFTTLFETVGEAEWLSRARELADLMITKFLDPERGGFYDSEEHVSAMLPVRPKSLFDSVVPSGNSAAAMALLRLSALTGDMQLLEPAENAIRLLRDVLGAHAGSFGYMLSALDFDLNGNQEIVIAGRIGAPDYESLLLPAFRRYLPNAVVVPVDPSLAGPSIPLLEGRTMLNGKATAYVCRSYACDLPTTDVSVLENQLSELGLTSWPG